MKKTVTESDVHEFEKDSGSEFDSDADADSDSTDIKIDTIDKYLDKFVSIGGSGWTFLVVNLLLIGWIIGLVPTKASVTWQSIISDAQAIFCYIYDSLLMRQQLQENEQLLATSGLLRSRMSSINRMVKKLRNSTTVSQELKNDIYNDIVANYDDATHLPSENIYDKVATICLTWIGLLTGLTVYWMGIFIWLGFGNYCDWSSDWQMYINSATSALMVFIFVFLANIRERNKKFIKNCFVSIYKVDIEIESKLRCLSNDNTPNEVIIVESSKPSRMERIIDIYAQVVGRLFGIIIIVVVLIVWVAIGPAMHFNNNWFLISGTYAGLIGLFDGFVLRNAYARSSQYEEDQFDLVKGLDELALQEIGIPAPEERQSNFNFSGRFAIKISSFFASKWTVLLGLIAIIGMVLAASALKWSVTGQLICNVPPSLIESFFMMVLITAHSIADTLRRDEVYNLCLRRQIILAYVNRVTKEEVEEGVFEGKDGEKV